jgi:2-C-methyl-D-erythritol 4-phosphate cytidylyltransferase
MVAWSIEAASASGIVDEIVIVAPPGRIGEVESVVGAGETIRVVAGGQTRAHSVAAGLDALFATVEIVLVQDAARPLARPELFRSVYEAVDDRVDGAIAATPLADTVKREAPDGTIRETVDRVGLWLAQTPQGFHVDAIRQGYAQIDEVALGDITDCASVIERAGGKVGIVPSGASNLKVTLPSDVALAESLMQAMAF